MSHHRFHRPTVCDNVNITMLCYLYMSQDNSHNPYHTLNNIHDLASEDVKLLNVQVMKGQQQQHTVPLWAARFPTFNNSTVINFAHHCNHHIPVLINHMLANCVYTTTSSLNILQSYQLSTLPPLVLQLTIVKGA